MPVPSQGHYGFHSFPVVDTTWNCGKQGRPSLLTPRDTRKLYGIVKSDRKRPLREVTNILNENRARPVSDRTVQRKVYETKYHKCVVKK
jgi:hypothetical protein